MTATKATAHFFVALNAEQGVPVEINLLPASALVTTVDGRGPYRVADVPRLIAESLQASGGRMPVDENHSIDLAAPKGEPSPARGWMTGLQSRADGIWAPVDWNESGRQLLADKAYRGISVVFHHDAAGTITRILRASLTNKPNLRGLVALNSETNMDLLAKLRKILGLAEDADEAAIIAAIEGKTGATAIQAAQTALQAQLAPIAKAAGLAEASDAATVLATVTTLATQAAAGGAKPETITALQTELAGVTTKLNDLMQSGANDRATAFVDGEIAKGRVGIKPMRAEYIAMHAANPGHTEKLIGAMPILGASGALSTPPKPDKDGTIALNSEQAKAADLLGIPHKDYAATLAAEQAA